jgi:hypothetical protein
MRLVVSSRPGQIEESAPATVGPSSIRLDSEALGHGAPQAQLASEGSAPSSERIHARAGTRSGQIRRRPPSAISARDCVCETFVPKSEHGGRDGDARAFVCRSPGNRFGDDTYTVDYDHLVRDRLIDARRERR